MALLESGIRHDCTAETLLVLAGERHYMLRDFRCELRTVAWVAGSRDRSNLPGWVASPRRTA